MWKAWRLSIPSLSQESVLMWAYRFRKLNDTDQSLPDRPVFRSFRAPLAPTTNRWSKYLSVTCPHVRPGLSALTGPDFGIKQEGGNPFTALTRTFWKPSSRFFPNTCRILVSVLFHGSDPPSRQLNMLTLIVSACSKNHKLFAKKIIKYLLKSFQLKQCWKSRIYQFFEIEHMWFWYVSLIWKYT